MHPKLLKIIITVFVLHLLTIIGLIVAFYVSKVDPKVLNILIYYLASFLIIYFMSVLCYFYITQEGYETVLIS